MLAVPVMYSMFPTFRTPFFKQLRPSSTAAAAATFLATDSA
jgi:hypothetical protein